MDIKNFIEKFAEAIEIEDASNLNGDTIFRNLEEWNSLAGLSIISMFEDEFDKDLQISDLKKAKTIKDLFNLAQ